MILEFFEAEDGVFTALGEECNYTITYRDRQGPSFDVRQDCDGTFLKLSFTGYLYEAQILAQAMEDKTIEAGRKCKRRKALKKVRRV